MRAPRTKWTPARVALLRKLYEKGLSHRAIGHQLGIDAQAVNNRLTFERRRPRDPLALRAGDAERKPRLRQPLPPPPPEIPPAVPQWLSGASPELMRVALAEGLGVAPEHGQVLDVLLRHLGERLSMPQLQAALGKHRPIKRQAIYERVRFLREVMGKDAIGGYREARYRFVDSPRDAGGSEYYLTDLGVQRCREALERVAQLLPLVEVARHPLRTPAKAAN